MTAVAPPTSVRRPQRRRRQGPGRHLRAGDPGARRPRCAGRADCGGDGARAKPSEARPDGGIDASSGPPGNNVGSPFTNQATPASGAQACDCRYHEAYNENGTDVDLTLLVNGSIEGGRVEGGGQHVEYARVGSSAQPFRFDYKIKTSSTQQGYNVSADLDLGIGDDYRDDYREGASDSEDRFALAMDGDYTARAAATAATSPATSARTMRRSRRSPTPKAP